MSDLADLLSHVPASKTAKDDVVRRLNEPHRHYHNLDHAVELWSWHNEYAHSQFCELDHTAISSFCLFHEAVYDPQKTKRHNKEAAAALWLNASYEYATTPLRITVERMILASANHFAEQGTGPLTWCLDLDLLRLGSAPLVFQHHGDNLRLEYGHLSHWDWVKASAEFRAKVMAQPRIFRHEQFKAAELRARANLARALLLDWTHLGYFNDSMV